MAGAVALERSHPALLAPVHLAVLGPGAVVGETGVLAGEPAADAAVALRDTGTLEFSARALGQIAEQFPDSTALLRQWLQRPPHRISEPDEPVVRPGTDGVPASEPS
jgi:CRP-like cAMP-binding protein